MERGLRRSGQLVGLVILMHFRVSACFAGYSRKVFILVAQVRKARPAHREFVLRSTRTMVKPKVYRNIVLFDQILMRACMTINMSGGRLWMVGVGVLQPEGGRRCRRATAGLARQAHFVCFAFLLCLVHPYSATRWTFDWSWQCVGLWWQRVTSLLL